jgi:hypothetical protein
MTWERTFGIPCEFEPSDPSFWIRHIWLSSHCDCVSLAGAETSEIPRHATVQQMWHADSARDAARDWIDKATTQLRH